MADDAQPIGSYLRINFTKFDWLAILTVIGLLLGAIWFVVDRTIVAETAQIRANLFVLEDEVVDTKQELTTQFGDLSTEFLEAETRIVAAFDTFSTEIAANVDSGLTKRTDELSRAFIAQFNRDPLLTIHVTNVPRDDNAVIQLVQAYMISHGSETVAYSFGDKLQFTSHIEDLDGSASRDLQNVLERLWVSHPEIETLLTYDPQKSEALSEAVE